MQMSNYKVFNKQTLTGKLNNPTTKTYPELENLTVTPSFTEQNFKSSKYGYNNVRVNAIEAKELNIDPTEDRQDFEGLYNKVVVNPITGSDLVVNPSTEVQTFQGLYSNVTVTEVEGETLSVNPTESEQHYEGLYGEVNVTAIDITTLEDYQNCLDITNDILGNYDYTRDGLRMYYDARQYQSGTTIKDLVNNNDASIIGTAYSKTDTGIALDGAFIKTGTFDEISGTWEIFCKVNSDFVYLPETYPQHRGWHHCSCILGCEISGTQQDFGLIIDTQGRFALGYSQDVSAYVGEPAIPACDGEYHHIVVTYNNKPDEGTIAIWQIYIDGVLARPIWYTLEGEIPPRFWIFGQGEGLPETAVHGEFNCFRHYTKVLSEEEV
jgi:hypothetical protein